MDFGIAHLQSSTMTKSGAGAGDRPLHGPRAGRGGEGRPPRGHLLGGRDRLRAARLPAALRRRQPHQRDVPHHARAAGHDGPAPQRIFARAGGHRVARAGQARCPSATRTWRRCATTSSASCARRRRACSAPSPAAGRRTPAELDDRDRAGARGRPAPESAHVVPSPGGARPGRRARPAAAAREVEAAIRGPGSRAARGHGPRLCRGRRPRPGGEDREPRGPPGPGQRALPRARGLPRRGGGAPGGGGAGQPPRRSTSCSATWRRRARPRRRCWPRIPTTRSPARSATGRRR